MKTLRFLLLAIICLSLLVVVPSVKAADGMTKNIIDSGSFQEGVTYERFSSTLTFDGSTTSQKISYVKKDFNVGNVKAVIWSTSTNQTVNKIAADFESNNPGYEVLAAINGDYFSGNDPINMEITNGQINKSTNHEKYFSIAINEQSNKITKVDELSYETNYTLTIYDESGSRIVKEVIIGINTEPNEIYQTSLYFNSSTICDVSDNIFIYETFLSNYDISNTSSYVFSGLILNSAITTGTLKNNLTIATMDSEIVELLNSKPRFKISKMYVSGSGNVIGVGSQPLKNNVVQPVSAIGDQSESFCVTRANRSSIGITASGSLIIAAIDGRQASAGMQGVTLREEAYIMQQLGCVNAFNLDGGGSTQLYIKEDGQFVLFNQPSETRAVANAVLFVQKKAGVSTDISVDKTTATMTLNNSVANAVTVLDTKVYCDNHELTYNNGNYKFKLYPNVIAMISVVMTYQYNDQIITETVLNQRVTPSGFDATCVARGVDKANLDYLIFASEVIDVTKYTDESANDFLSALTQAQEVSDKDLTDYNEVSLAYKILKTSVESLIEKTNGTEDTPIVVDKAALSEMVAEGKAINKLLYTTASCQTLQVALNKAQLLLDSEDVTQEEIDSVLSELQTAINNMEKITSDNQNNNCTNFKIIEFVFAFIPMFFVFFVLRKNFIK